MKNRILMIAALFAVMVSMTGIATALSLTITPSANMKISPGGTIDQYVAVVLDNSADELVGFTIAGIAIGGHPTLFDPQSKFTVMIDGATTNSDTNQYFQSHTYDITYIDNKNAALGDYTLQYTIDYIDSQGLPQQQTKDILVTIDVIKIPEFPTVALPIAAVIGLVFFFHIRKRKEE